MSSTTTIVQKDHITAAFRRLLSQYRTKTKIVAFVRALARAANVCEEELFSLLISFDLSNANHNRLDVWGAIVGEQCGPLNDEDYRRFIRARMLVNTSNGTPDELINIFATVTAPSSIYFRNSGNASFMIYAIRQEALSDDVYRRAGRIMLQAKPAGVNMTAIEAVGPYFGFAENPDARGFDEGMFSRILMTG